VSRFDLGEAVPPAVRALPTLYLLGVGGPEDPEGIGRVETFAWRFAVVEGGAGALTALAFTAMPRLMALTRAVNGRRPFTLPTEALRVDPSGIGPTPGVGLFVDPSPEEVEALLAGGRLAERRLPSLEGAGS